MLSLTSIKLNFMKTILKSILAFVFAILAHNSYAQFATATVNAVIGAGEYGVHSNGQNQETSGAVTTYIAWDATNLYVGVSGANITEGFVMYIDTDPQVPVNGGTNANGTNVGFPYDLANFASLQFRANAVIYAKNGYREFRTADGSNGWSGPTAGFGSYLDDAGSIREFSLPWASIGGFPASFNFFNYVTSSTGFVYGQTPTVNAGGNIGLSARYERYYTVSTTAAIGTTKPFNRESYVFNSTANNNAFGAITVHDFTMNSSGLQIARTGVTNWIIGGNLVVGAGTVFFGSGGSYGTSTIANVNVVGGTLNMDATTNPMNVSGNVSISAGATLALSSGIGGDLNIAGSFNNSGTFTPNSRAVTFNGTSGQTINGATTFAFLTITNSSANVTANSPITVTNNLTINGSPTLTRLDMAANTLTLTGTSTITSGFLRTGGTITGGTNTFGANGTYEHNLNGGTIPTATWSAGSTCAILGIGISTPTGLGQSFSNFTWNCTGQTGAIGLAGLLTTIGGNFNVLSTNGLQLRLGSTQTFTTTIGGNLNLSSGTLSLVSSTGATTVNLAGDLNITGGTLEMSVAAGTSILNVTGNFSQTSGTIQKTGGTATITFNNTSARNITQSGGTISGTINWNVGTGSTLTTRTLTTNLNLGTGTGTFTMNTLSNFNPSTFILSGSGTFHSLGGTLQISNAAGISASGATGCIQTTTRTFGTSASYFYNTGASITGTGLPATIFNMLVPTGGLILTNSVTTNGTLTINGIFDLGANTLTINGGIAGGPSASNYIKADPLFGGKLSQTVTSTAVVFPVGNSSYNPITLTNTGTSDVFSVSVADVNASTMANNTTKQVNRNWQITEGTAGGSILSIVAQYNTSDGAQANFAAGTTPKIGVLDGGIWLDNTATAAGSNPFTYTSTTPFSGLTGPSFIVGIGKDDAFLQTTYSSTTLGGNWSSAATWLGGIVPPSGAIVTIDGPVTLNQDATVSSLTINLGKTFTSNDGTNRILTINNSVSGTTLLNNGTWTNGAAVNTVSFTGAAIHTVSGNITFQSVTTTTGVNFGTNARVRFSFTILAGGFVSVNPPVYETTTSTLVYNTGGAYNRGAEWNSSNTLDAPGYPQNDVFIQSGTLNIGGTDPANPHYCRSDFWILSGASVTMNQPGFQMTTFNQIGRLRLDGTLTLSGLIGGDLQITGAVIAGATGNLVTNGRTVTFTGTQSSQPLRRTGGGTITLDNVVIDKTIGTVSLDNVGPNQTNLVINGFLTLSGTNTNQLDLNGRTLQINGTNNINISGNVTKNINSTVAGAQFFINGGVKTVVAGGTTLLNFVSNVNVVTTGGINFGANVSTVNGFLSIGFNGFVSTNPPTYTSTSTLEYSTGTVYMRGAEWTQNVISGPGFPNNVTITNATAFDGNNTNFIALNGNFTCVTGSSVVMSLSVGGDLHFYGNVTFQNSTTLTTNQRTLHFKGTNAQAFNFFVNNFDIDYLLIDKTAGTLTATCTQVGGGNLRIYGNGASTDVLYLQNGTLSLGTDTELRFQNTGAKNIRLGASGTRTLSAFRVLGTGLLTVTSDGATMLNIGLLNCSGPINCGSSLTTITTTFSLNAAGSIVTNPPIYGVGSTLLYTGGTRTRALEWSSSTFPGPGTPSSVRLQGSQVLNFGVNTATPVTIPSVLNIQAGSTLNMNSPSAMTADVQVLSLVLLGDLIFSNSASLPNFIVNNGNVTIDGNLTQNGNNFIIQGTTNGIIGGTNAKFGKLQYNRTGVAAVHSADIYVCELSIGAASNFVVQNGRTLIVDVNLYSPLFTGPPPPPPSGYVTKNGSLSFLGTGYMEFQNGYVTFDGSSPTTFKKVSLDNATALFTTNAYTISDTLVLKNASSFDNSSIAPTYGASSYLIYSGNGSIVRGAEWSAFAGAGKPQNVTVRTNTNLQFASTGTNETIPVRVSNNFIIEGGSTVNLNSGGNEYKAALTVAGKLFVGNVGNGTLILSNSAGGEDFNVASDILVNAGSTLTTNDSKVILTGASSQDISILGSGDFHYLKLLGNGGARLLSNINVTDELEFNNSGNGDLDLNNFNVFLLTNASIQQESNNARIINTAGTVVHGQGYIGFTANILSPTLTDASNLGIELNSISGNIGNVTVRRYAQAINGVGTTASITRVYEVVAASALTATATIDYLNVAGELNGNTPTQGQFQLFTTNTLANFDIGANYNYISPSNIGTLQLSSPTNIDLISGSNFFTAASIVAVPLSGIINVPSEVTTLEEVVNDLNVNGVGVGGLTVNIAPGYIGTLGNIVIDVQNNPPSASNPIIFQGDPNNLPTFNARPGGTIDRDGVVRIVGTSFVTIQNIIFVDPPINDDNFERMEWGIAILKKTNNDASQNITIRNCRIFLQNADTASTGVYIGNHSFDPTQSFTPTLPTGNFDQIRIWGNTITRVNKGVILRGFAHPSFNLLEKNIFIGDSLVTQNGNIFNNLGGNATPTIGVHLNNAASFVIGNNSFDNTANGGQNSQGDIRGISVTGNSSGNSVIASNTLSLKQAATDKPMMVINNGLNSPSAFLRIKKNVIQNSLVTAGSSGEFFAIRNVQPEIFKLQIDSNRIINNVNINTSANVYGIYNTSETERVYFLRDTVRNFTSSTPADMFVIYNPSGADSVVVAENTITNITKSGSGGQLAVYYNDAVAGFVAMASQSNNGGVQVQAGAGVERIVKNYIKNVTGFGVANVRGILTTGRTSFDKIVNENKIKTFTAFGGTIKGITIADGNDISANANTLDNYTSNSSIYAVEAINGVTLSIDNDSIFNISQTGAGSAYGIYHTTTSSGGHTKNIQNNDILNISKTTSTGDVYAIAHEESGNGSTSMTTNDNFIDDISNSGAGAAYGIFHTGSGSGGPHNNNYTSNNMDNVVSSGAGSAYGIFHTGSGSGGPHNINFTTNTVGNVSNSGSGSAYGIFHTGSGSGGPHNYVNVGNTINAISNSSGGESYGIYNESAGTAAGVVNQARTITGNTISNVSNTGGGAAYGIFHTGSGSGGPHNVNSSTNDIGFVSSNGAGAAYGIFHTGSGSGGPHNFTNSNNIIGNISNTSSGNAYGIFHTGSGSGGPHNSSRVSNTISNVSNSGSGNAYGIFHTGSGSGGPHIGITRNNTITDLSTSSGSGACYGIFHTGSGSGGPHKARISGNVLSNFSSASDSIEGIRIAIVDSIAMNSNKIVEFSSVSGKIEGINITSTQSGLQGLVSNSVIGDFTTISSNTSDAIAGINVNGTAGNNLKFYYNSVYLQASSSGGAFGSTAFSFNSAVPVDLRNNIFINRSNASSGGGVRVLTRNGASGGLLNTSNNNAYFVSDSTIANNFVFSDGTNNFQSFNAYRTFIGFENSSFAENVNFISADGLNANFLKINTVTETRIESGGTISNLGITTDAISVPRFGSGGYAGIGTATDIGAYENNYTPILYQWLGLVSNNWNSAGNWTGGVLPNSTRDIVINAITSPQPNLNSVDAVVRKIKFVPNGAVSPSITIPSGRKLVVEGNIEGNGNFIGNGLLELNSGVAQTISGTVSAVNVDVNNSNGVSINLPGRLNVSRELGLKAGVLTTNSNNLVITSSGSTAGYINDFAGGYAGSISGGVRVQRFVSQPVPAAHTIASPVINGSTTSQNYSDNFSVAGSPSGYVYNTNPNLAQPSPFPTTWWFDETLTAVTTPGWVNGRDKVMTPGLGIMATIPQNRLIDVVGTANTGLVNIPVTRTDDGLNLIGNPYPSPISLNAMLGANSGTLLPFVYVWNKTNYAVYSSGTGIWVNNIGAGSNDRMAHSQGFFVISTVPGIANVSMDNNMRTTNQSHVYFATPQNECRIQLKEGEESDELLIRTDGESSDEYNVQTDAKKILNEPIYSSTLYSMSSDNYPLAINTLKDFDQDKVVPLGIKSKSSGKKELLFNELNSIDPSVNIYLEDVTMGKLQDMRANNKYEVNLSEGNSGSRFYVHFSKKALINTAETANQSQIYSNQSQLFIDLTTSTGNSEVRIYNSLGQMVEYKNISSSNGGKAQLNIQNLSGAYVVQLTSNGEVKNQKVVFGE
jgi:hypothetical protein